MSLHHILAWLLYDCVLHAVPHLIHTQHGHFHLCIYYSEYFTLCQNVGVFRQHSLYCIVSHNTSKYVKGHQNDKCDIIIDTNDLCAPSMMTFQYGTFPDRKYNWCLKLMRPVILYRKLQCSGIYAFAHPYNHCASHKSNFISLHFHIKDFVGIIKFVPTRIQVL